MSRDTESAALPLVFHSLTQKVTDGEELQRSPGPVFALFDEETCAGEGDLSPGITQWVRAHGQSPGLLIHRPGVCSLPSSASEGTGDYPFSRCSGLYHRPDVH